MNPIQNRSQATSVLKAAFVGRDRRAWSETLAGILQEFQEARIEEYDSLDSFAASPDSAQAVFVDDSESERLRELDVTLRAGRAFFLIVPDPNTVPPAFIDHAVDDVLVRPFRPVEVLSKLKHVQQVMRWGEVQSLNQSFQQLIGQLKDDLTLAERIQKSRHPKRFEDLRGFRFQSRYLSGLRPGGDYFDVIESDSGDRIVVLLTDSSSYGLSNAVLTVLMRVAVRVGSQDLKSIPEFLKRISDEIAMTLGERDSLSTVIAVINRKDLSLRYVSLGECGLFVRTGGERAYKELKAQGEGIRRGTRVKEFKESEVKLEPGDRLVLASDGFLKGAGGKREMLSKLERLDSKEALDVLNELAYHAKKSSLDPEFPPEDCTGIVIDLDAKLMRLA